MKVLLPILAVVLTGCSSATTIRVSDADTRIYVNGEFLGTGEARYKDRKPAFTRQEVTLRKDGCEAQTLAFRRSERPAVGAIISAYYLYVPILWISKYKPQHEYEFFCERITAAD